LSGGGGAARGVVYGWDTRVCILILDGEEGEGGKKGTWCASRRKEILNLKDAIYVRFEDYDAMRYMLYCCDDGD